MSLVDINGSESTRAVENGWYLYFTFLPLASIPDPHGSLCQQLLFQAIELANIKVTKLTE